jgi:hypothetical protein
MTDKTIDLDRRRGMEAQKATDLRRLLSEVEANERALRLRQEELEAHLAGAPAANWEELAEKARYVFGLYAATFRRRHAPANLGRGRAEGSGAPRQRVVSGNATTASSAQAAAGARPGVSTERLGGRRTPSPPAAVIPRPINQADTCAAGFPRASPFVSSCSQDEPVWSGASIGGHGTRAYGRGAARR